MRFKLHRTVLQKPTLCTKARRYVAFNVSIPGYIKSNTKQKEITVSKLPKDLTPFERTTIQWEWNVTLAGLMKEEKYETMDDLFLQLQEKSQVDGVTWTTMISSAIRQKNFGIALYYVSEMQKQYSLTPQVYSLLFKLLADDKERCDSLVEELKLSGMQFDTILLEQMVVQYGEWGDYKRMLHFFEDHSQCPPSTKACSLMIHYCCKALDVDNASRLIPMLAKRTRKNARIPAIALWKLINLMKATGRMEEMKSLYSIFMNSENVPDVLLFTTMLGYFKDDRHMLEQIWKDMRKKRIIYQIRHYNILLGCYSKIPDEEACEKFFKLFEQQADLVSYNTLLGLYYKTSNLEKLELTWKKLTEKFKPNEVSYSQIVAAAWSRKDVPKIKQIKEEMEANQVLPLGKTKAIFNESLGAPKLYKPKHHNIPSLAQEQMA